MSTSKKKPPPHLQPIPIRRTALPQEVQAALRTSGSLPGSSIRLGDEPGRLVSARKLGKVRLRVVDETGEPHAGAQLRVSVRQDGERVTQRLVTAGPTGYIATGFDIEVTPETAIEVEPAVAKGVGEDGPSYVFDLERDLVAGAPIVRFDRNDISRAIGNVDHGSLSSPPEPEDVENAPELFKPTIIHKDGNCALDFAADVEVRQHYFNQIVRLDTPALSPSRAEPKRVAIESPIPFEHDTQADLQAEGSSADVVQAGQATLGKLNLYRQSWTRVGHGIGELLYSLSLAPCEETRVAIVDWSRDDEAARRDRATTREQLDHRQHRDRMIEEVVEGVVDEVQSGHSQSVQGGGGISGGAAGFFKGVLGSLGFSLGGGAASSGSFSEGHRDVSASTIQSLSDTIVQRSSAMRSLNSTVVTQAAQVEREEIRTRVVRNRNRNHAMTVEYFQVLEHYIVRNELYQQSDVLLVPYEVPEALWEAMPPFSAFHFRDVRKALEAVGLNALQRYLSSGGSSNGSFLDRAYDAVFGGGAGGNAWRSRFIGAVNESVAEAVNRADPADDLEDQFDEVPNIAWNRLGEERLNQGLFRRSVSDAISARLQSLENTEGLLSSSNLIRWLDRNGERLSRFLPRAHRAGLRSLYRLLHTPEIYESDAPAATVSRWTVELREGWRPGVSVIVHTTDGQSIPLRHEGQSHGTAINRFSSPPVDITSIRSFEVVYSPDEAKRSVLLSVAKDLGVGGLAGDLVDAATDVVGAVFGALGDSVQEAVNRRVEVVNTYDLDRLRISATLDPSRHLSSAGTYELLDLRNRGTELTAADPSRAYSGVRIPEIDFVVTATRRYRDYARVEALVRHIRSNRMPYLRALWLTEDPDRRALRFDQYYYPYEAEDGAVAPVPLLELIENRPVGVLGNCIAFRIQQQGQLATATRVPYAEAVDERVVSLPTRGVYAETLLSRCNATEVRDVTRRIDSEDSCGASAPQITGITTGSRSRDVIPDAARPPSPSVNIQNVPNAPDPTGLSGALELLGRGDIFRDMSLGTETVNAVRSLVDRAMQESGEAQRATLNALNTLLDGGAENGGEGDSGGSSGAGAGGTGRSSGGATSSGSAAQRAAADQAYRGSDPARNFDHQQVLRSSDLPEDVQQRAGERLHNAVAGWGAPTPIDGPSGVVTEDISQSLDDFWNTLRYLGTNASDFMPYENAYFQRLRELLLFHGTIDDDDLVDPFRFGTHVRAFQASAGVTEDGILGDGTLWALQVDWANANQLGTVELPADKWAPSGRTWNEDDHGYDKTRLRGDTGQAYQALYDEAQQLGIIVTSAGGRRELTQPGASGQSALSFHYPGLAFDLAKPSGMEAAGGGSLGDDPYVITEDGRFMRVWALSDQGEEKTLDAVVWRDGKKIVETTQTVIDFTALAEKHGFVRVPPRDEWPNNWSHAEWWHFQYPAGAVPFISQFGAEIIRRVGRAQVASQTASSARARSVWTRHKRIRKPGLRWG